MGVGALRGMWRLEPSAAGASGARDQRAATLFVEARGSGGGGGGAGLGGAGHRERGDIVVGREPDTSKGGKRRDDVDIFIEDKSLSRRHAQFSARPAGGVDEAPGLTIADLGSKYGTWIQNRVNSAWDKLAKGGVSELQDKDVIRLGVNATAYEVLREPVPCAACSGEFDASAAAAVQQSARAGGVSLQKQWTHGVTHLVCSGKKPGVAARALSAATGATLVRPAWLQALADARSAGPANWPLPPAAEHSFDPAAYGANAEGRAQAATLLRSERFFVGHGLGDRADVIALIEAAGGVIVEAAVDSGVMHVDEESFCDCVPGRRRTSPGRLCDAIVAVASGTSSPAEAMQQIEVRTEGATDEDVTQDETQVPEEAMLDANGAADDAPQSGSPVDAHGDKGGAVPAPELKLEAGVDAAEERKSPNSADVAAAEGCATIEYVEMVDLTRLPKAQPTPDNNTGDAEPNFKRFKKVWTRPARMRSRSQQTPIATFLIATLLR